MLTRLEILAFASAALAFAGAAHAEKTNDRPELFRKLIDCRAIADNVQRLACYDAQVGALDVAEQKKDLVVVDRAQMKETRKSLFGFTLPRLGIFGSGGDKEIKADDISEIDSLVESARPIAGGNWSIKLANDAGTWETLNALDAAPKGGDKVHIKKAMMGSYLGSIGNFNRGVRFRRVG
jgi:hypothetical protein